MARNRAMRWALFIHDPDGDMGDAMVLGAFRTPEAADAEADRIRRAGARRARDSRVAAGYADGLECIVLPLLPGGTSADYVTAEVICGAGQ